MIESCWTIRFFCWESIDAMDLTEPLTEDLTDCTKESARFKECFAEALSETSLVSSAALTEASFEVASIECWIDGIASTTEVS